LENRIAELSSRFDRLSEEVRERCEATDRRFETVLREEIRKVDDKAESRLRVEIAAMKELFESRIRAESSGITSRFKGAIESPLSAVVSRLQTEIQNQAGATMMTLREEIQTQQGITESKFTSEIDQRCSGFSTAIRAELEEERRFVRTALMPLGTSIPQGDAPIDGIIAWLSRKCGGNVVDKGVVIAGPAENPRNAFDYQNTTSHYCHQQGPPHGPWLSIDFKKMRVHITAYSIQANSRVPNCAPNAWVLEGSDDGTTWFPLDTRTDRNELQDTSRAFTFSVATPRPCNHLRFRKTSGCDSPVCSNLFLTAIEFFGVVWGSS
jgi:hypothetical protein